MTLVLSAALWKQVVEHVRAGAPNEACGLLAGEGGHVREAFLMANAARSPWEYRMAPTEQVRAMLEIEGRGWELTAIFHSHPAGPPTPSAADVAQAYYPEALYLILTPDARGEWRGRAFRIVAGRVEEVPVQFAE